MREDMDRVVTDRPRHKGRWCNDIKIKYKSLEDAPTKQGMRRPYTNRKEFSDHIKPLLRFLSSNIGRPWNKVYSEICEHITLDSTMQRHILEHVKTSVELDVQMIDGNPHHTTVRAWHSGYLPIESTRNYQQLYVHPANGLLCLAPRAKKRVVVKQVELVVLPDNKFLQFRKETKVRNKGRKNEQVTVKWVALELAERPEDVTETDVKQLSGAMIDKRWVAGNVIRTEATFTPGRDAFFKEPLRVFSESASQKYYSNSNLYCFKVRDVNTKELQIINQAISQ
jgi:hypothetical protein